MHERYISTSTWNVHLSLYGCVHGLSSDLLDVHGEWQGNNATTAFVITLFLRYHLMEAVFFFQKTFLFFFFCFAHNPPKEVCTLWGQAYLQTMAVPSHLYHWPCLLEGSSWVLSEEDWFDFNHYLLIDKASAGALLIPWGEVLKMEDMFLPNDIDATHTRSNSTNVCAESTQSLYLVSFSIPKHSLRTPTTKDCTGQPES